MTDTLDQTTGDQSSGEPLMRIDEATGNQLNNDAADALNDATDGHASTNP